MAAAVEDMAVIGSRCADLNHYAVLVPKQLSKVLLYVLHLQLASMPIFIQPAFQYFFGVWVVWGLHRLTDNGNDCLHVLLCRMVNI